MMRRASFLPTLGLFLFTAAPGAAQVHRSAQHDFRIVTVADGLVEPWSMAFLPGGDLLVTERAGRLRVIRDGALLPEPVAGLPRVRAEGQGGLLDVVLHPAFAENRLVYFSYSKPSDDGSRGTTAVARGRFEGDRLHGVEDVFVADLWSTGRGHYGSRLAFDGQGYLFITLGDRQSPAAGDLEAHPAQDLSNHFGSTIRLHGDGSVPADNPFVGRDGVRPEIWTYGHRNMQGLAIHPETGDVWVNEHGPQGGDELNLLQPGRNYGWPVVGYGVNYRTGLAIHEGTMREGMEHPMNVWVPSIGISGMAIYTGDAFPRWRGNIFVGGLAGEMLVRLTMDGRQVTNVEQMVQRRGRVRTIRQGPDGYLYLALESDDGSPTPIVRLEPAEAAEAPSAPPGFAQEFAGQFDGSARKLVALAEAMPADRYGWRPMEGVSSVAQVFMHVARYNYMYPHETLGVAPPSSASEYMTWEESVTDKARAVEILAASMDHVRRVAAGMDAAAMDESTRLYGREVAQWAVLFQLVAHMNEHLGQSIAYARMNQVVPPWSR